MTRGLPYNRAERVADEIYRVVAECLFTEISDPRLRGIEVTRVRMTRDLKIARIYFHSEGASGEQLEKAREGFKSAGGYLKQKIGRELKLKYIPEMEFFYDETIDLRDKIDKLFDEKGGSDYDG